MRRFWSMLKFRITRRTRSFRPVVGQLENREVMSTVVAALTVTPSILNPPNNSYRTVVVSGTIAVSKANDTPNVSYQVVDDYRLTQPIGKVPLIPTAIPTLFNFSFPLTFQAKRVNEYPAGRHYYVLVKTADYQNANGEYAAILVPHNKLPPGTTTIPSTVETVPTPKPKKVVTTPVNKPVVKHSKNSGFGSIF